MKKAQLFTAVTMNVLECCLSFPARSALIFSPKKDGRVIPANIVDALAAQNIHLRCFLYELATKRFSDVMWAMQQILFKGLDRRLAEFLLAEAARTGSDTIRMTHTQIAQHISSAREAVARMLKSFSEDGLVDLKRSAITLRDTDGLHRLK